MMFKLLWYRPLHLCLSAARAADRYY